MKFVNSCIRSDDPRNSQIQSLSIKIHYEVLYFPFLLFSLIWSSFNMYYCQETTFWNQCNSLKISYKDVRKKRRNFIEFRRCNYQRGIYDSLMIVQQMNAGADSVSSGPMEFNEDSSVLQFIFIKFAFRYQKHFILKYLIGNVVLNWKLN